MMLPYRIEDRARLVFEPKVVAGELKIEIQVPGSTNREMAEGECVEDYTYRPAPNLPDDPEPPENHVNVRVLDSANIMGVETTGYTWTQFPVGSARQGVSTDLPIPIPDNDELSVLIKISTVIGGELTKRTQKVIIKHKPSTTG